MIINAAFPRRHEEEHNIVLYITKGYILSCSDQYIFESEHFFSGYVMASVLLKKLEVSWYSSSISLSVSTASERRIIGSLQIRIVFISCKLFLDPVPVFQCMIDTSSVVFSQPLSLRFTSSNCFIVLFSFALSFVANEVSYTTE